MIVEDNIHLKNYNTFGLDYTAHRIIKLKSADEASSLFREKRLLDGPVKIIGAGSNLLFTGDFPGILVHPEFDEIKTEGKSGNTVIISAGAGCAWDKLVEWTVNQGFAGIENLSYIPGTVGASAVQNIGAYGAEAKDTIEKVVAVSTDDGSLSSFSKKECEFDYRHSIFKGEGKGRFFVTKVYFKLTTDPVFNLEYGSLKEEIEKLGTETLSNIRQAVINIRKNKLPDPAITGNAGSFFKNPAVNEDIAKDLKLHYPQMPVYPCFTGYSKLAAGWLIEQCGWKGKRNGDAGVHSSQALVLINHGNASGRQIYDLSEEIKNSVNEKFGIELEREVEIIGPI